MTLIVKHSTAIFIAFLVGIISVLPQVLATEKLGEDYHGVQFLYIDDEDVYRARINEILDGHRSVASPYVYEYKDAHVMLQPIGEFFYALPAYIIGLNASILLAKFLFPALLFLLVYLVAIKLNGEFSYLSQLCAISAGLLTTLAVDFVDYNFVLRTLTGEIQYTHLSVWTRLVNPITGGLLFFTFLLLILMIFQKRTYLRLSILAGGVVGLMVGYFFSFGLALTVLGSLMLLSLILKEYDTFKRLAVVLGVSIILDLFYWINLFTALDGDAGRVLAQRNGMQYTHAPILNKFLFAVTLFFFSSYFLTKKLGVLQKVSIRSWYFMGALLAASWIVFNQQILTGREVWYHHFVQYTIPLGFIIVTSCLYFLLKDRFPKILLSVTIIFIVSSVAWGIMMMFTYRFNMDNFKQIQEYTSLFNHLNNEAPKDCVLLLREDNQELERLLPAYTHCNVYSTIHTFYGVPEDRVLHNFLLRLRLNNIELSNLDQYLVEHEEEVRGYFFTNWKQMFGSGQDEWVIQKNEYLRKEYEQFLQGDLKEQILMYRIDYLATTEILPEGFTEKPFDLRYSTTTSGLHLYVFQ